MTTQTPERKIKRSRVLSISERNRTAEDTIENIQDEYGLSFSQAVFHLSLIHI